MWDGNFVTLTYTSPEPLLSENQCGMETTVRHSTIFWLLLVEREPMWDGNLETRIFENAVVRLSENQCGMET